MDDTLNESQPSNSADAIALTLPDSARSISSEAFTLTLMQELTAQSAAFEPTLMRHGNGWLIGPVDIHVTDIERAADGSNVVVKLGLRFQTQSVPGCGTDALSSEHQLPAGLYIQLPHGDAVLTIGL